MKRLLLGFTFIFALFSTLRAQEASDSIVDRMEPRDYIPHIEGTIRAKYEYNTTDNLHRFQVRNARFSVNGKIHPMISYKAEIDLSEEGETLMLDAFGCITPYKGLSFTLGQMKVPFSTDNLRSPHQLYFANRSFIGKQMSNGLRDVGLKIDYQSKLGEVPFAVAAGVYNGDGIYNQKGWQSQFNYALRAELWPVSWLNVSLNFNTIRPDSLRMYLYDVGCYADFHNIHLESEYIYKTYENSHFAPTHALSTFGAYRLNVKKKMCNYIALLARYDIMGDNSRGVRDAAGQYFINDHHTQRVTVGATWNFMMRKVMSEFRLNYEIYIEHTNAKNEDKLVAELVVRF